MRVFRSCMLAVIAMSGVTLPAGAQADAALPGPRLAPLKVRRRQRTWTRTAKACIDFFQFANGGWLEARHDPRGVLVVGRGARHERPQPARRALGARRRGGAARHAPRRQHAAQARHVLRDVHGLRGRRAGGRGAAQAGARRHRRRCTTRAQLLGEIAALQSDGRRRRVQLRPRGRLRTTPRTTSRGFVAAGSGCPTATTTPRPDPSSDSLARPTSRTSRRCSTLGGEPAAARSATRERVLALETELAKASLERVARRDPAATDHPMTLRAAARRSRRTSTGRSYFHDVGPHAPVTKVNVAEPAFFKRRRTRCCDHAARRLARVSALPRARRRVALAQHAVREREFRVQRRASPARRQLLPRWKRCLRDDRRPIGEALGQAYVAKTFPPSARARAKAVIDDIRASFGERAASARLDVATRRKQQALDKLAQMGEKVGYPDTWRDYSKLEVGGRAVRAQRRCARTRSSGSARSIGPGCRSTRPSGASPCRR